MAQSSTGLSNFDDAPNLASTERSGLYSRMRSYTDSELFQASTQWSRAQVSSAPLVLEVGPGLADSVAILSQHTEVHCVDFVPEPVKAALVRGATSGFVASVLDLPFDAGTYSAVLADRVCHHIPSPAEALHEMVRVTADGGVVTVTVPATELSHTNAPAEAFERFMELRLTPGLVSASPLAAQILADASNIPARVKKVERRLWKSEDLASWASYVVHDGMFQKLCNSGHLARGDADVLTKWWESGHATWTLTLAGFSYHL